MTKNTFIRATEIWLPTPDRRSLDLVSGLYGDLTYFEAISHGTRFGYGEGLSGKTWEDGHPIVLKDLTSSYFHRRDAAISEGLTSAVSMPIFIGNDLSAVVIFFCGDNRYHVGAIELWRVSEADQQMILVDGYFGYAEAFESASRQAVFPRKMGLPGKVWDSGMPVILEDLGRDDLFLRRESAELAGLNRAVSLPCTARGGGEWALTFLSAQNSPIAKRFECWAPDDASGTFNYTSGYCESGIDLVATYAAARVPLDFGPLAEARRTGIPVICSDLLVEKGPIAQSATLAGLSKMVALPIFSGGTFKAVLAWFF